MYILVLFFFGAALVWPQLLLIKSFAWMTAYYQQRQHFARPAAHGNCGGCELKSSGVA